VNEVFDGLGSRIECGGAPYIELKNTGNERFALNGFVLEVEGSSGTRISSITKDLFIDAGAFLLFCELKLSNGLNSNDPITFGGFYSFEINSSDSVFLVTPDGDVASATGTLPLIGTPLESYQRLPDGSYQLAEATPAQENVFQVAEEGMYQPCFDSVSLCFQAVLRANYLAHSKSHAMLALFSHSFNYCFKRFILFHDRRRRGW
jgi:hypothetical protein